MNTFLRLVWKEMRELLRPQYILPILFIPIIFVALGQGFGGLDEATSEPPEVGIVNNDDGEYGNLVEATYDQRSDVVYRSNGTDPERALDETQDRGGTALIVIPENFTERIETGQQRGQVRLYTVVDSVSLTGIASTGQVETILQTAGTQITINATGASPQQLAPIETSYTTDVKGTRISQSPGTLSGAVTSQFIFIPVIIMLVIIFSGQMVINSMGMEKENKTLETLLTMPVKRRTIVAAKLVGSAAIGLLAAGIMTIALREYQSGITGGGGSDLPAAFSLGLADYALIGVAIFFAVVGALALALVLGIFAGDRQGAQILLFPLSILAIGPAFATMFTDFSTLSLPLQAVLFAIPFTHPVVAPKQLMFGDPTLVYLGIAYEALFAVAAIALAVSVFNSDRVVTGSAGRLGTWLSKLQR
ncbi:ABC transporter permease [Salinibaculum rarum]|uniref:ABC transporter permease n=1 Tax=Salinibaculum rarum TaxID=3058903 RepID=UPI00265E023D|nr:ABC transporter permease [Salinibaculum sp. KK48]